jgi:hypothetical protein
MPKHRGTPWDVPYFLDPFDYRVLHLSLSDVFCLLDDLAAVVLRFPKIVGHFSKWCFAPRQDVSDPLAFCHPAVKLLIDCVPNLIKRHPVIDAVGFCPSPYRQAIILVDGVWSIITVRHTLFYWVWSTTLTSVDDLPENASFCSGAEQFAQPSGRGAALRVYTLARIALATATRTLTAMPRKPSETGMTHLRVSFSRSRYLRCPMLGISQDRRFMFALKRKAMRTR